MAYSVETGIPYYTRRALHTCESTSTTTKLFGKSPSKASCLFIDNFFHFTDQIILEDRKDRNGLYEDFWFCYITRQRFFLQGKKTNIYGLLSINDNSSKSEDNSTTDCNSFARLRLGSVYQSFSKHERNIIHIGPTTYHPSRELEIAGNFVFISFTDAISTCKKSRQAGRSLRPQTWPRKGSSWTVGRTASL